MEDVEHSDQQVLLALAHGRHRSGVARRHRLHEAKLLDPSLFPVVDEDLGASPEQRSLADAHGAALRAAADARAQPVRSVIIDAEVLVYDREKSQVEEFGFVQSMAPGNTTSMAAVRKGKKNLLVVVFDVLYLNGRDLVNEGTPLRERATLLRLFLEPIPTFAEVVPTAEHVRADDEEALLASLGRVVRWFASDPSDPSRRRTR